MTLQDDLNVDSGLRRDMATSSGEAADAALPAGLQVDEALGLGQGTEFAPVARGNEASRSAQSFTELTSWTVPANRYGLLVDVSASIASNGEVRIAVAGSDPIDYTGELDISLPFDGAVLLPGSTVRILHQSTDGSSATNRGSITGKEV